MTQTELRPCAQSASPCVTPRLQRGFTLIELMIVCAVIAILATLAINSYRSSLIKSRRGTAQACLTEEAQYMERYYSTNMTYVGAVPPACSQSMTGFYTRPAPTTTVTTFSATVVPQGGQTVDTCGTMTINQAGTRTPTSNCW